MSPTPVLEIGERVVYALQPKQLRALAKTPLSGGKAVHVGYGGAAGGGKSHLARAVAALVAWLWPGSTGIIFRRTHPEVLENHIVSFRAEVPEEVDGQRIYTWRATESAAMWANGSRTLFGYLGADDDVYRYQGAQYDLMVFEEATHYTWFQVSWLVGNRLRASVPGSVPFALYPSNPGNRGHAWYKRLFIDRNFRSDLNETASDYAFVQAKLADNAVLTDRDPSYLRKLDSLPEPLRSQLRDGDWAAGSGLALPDLRRTHPDSGEPLHLVPAFDVPHWWFRWNAFDWGFNHPWLWGHFAADTDGNAYLVDSVMGRHLKDWEIIERIRQAPTVDLYASKFSVAGHDCWADYRARTEHPETTADRFRTAGIPLRQANVSRVTGLANMREYIDWRRTGEPRFRIMDTPTNRRVFDCLESMVVDPDNPEDALKLDADDFGDGGDDAYDMTRYGLAARPAKGDSEPEPELPAQHYDRGYHDVVERYQKLTSGKKGRGF